MFESRLQIAQFWLATSALLTIVAVLVFSFGPIVVAIFCLVLAHGGAATGCAFYADTKGYPAIIGIPIGIGLGVMGAVLVLILPDQSEANSFDVERELSREGVRNARHRDRGYEVLDDDRPPRRTQIDRER
jgi:multidrug efflux pump subunit AcrB